MAQLVMDYLAYGWSVEEMYRQHPNLRLSEVHTAMGYYFDNQAIIDQEIKDEWTHVQQAMQSAPKTPFFLRMRAKGLL